MFKSRHDNGSHFVPKPPKGKHSSKSTGSVESHGSKKLNSGVKENLVFCDICGKNQYRCKCHDEEDELVGEYELHDILEDVTGKNDIDADINIPKLEAVVKENIEYTLKREKKFGSDFSVVLPVGALSEVRSETTDETGFYQYDFEIFEGSNDIPYRGTAYGAISAGEMLDMTVELYRFEK